MASRLDYEEAEMGEDDREDEREDDFSGQVTTPQLSRTYKSTSLLNRPYSLPSGNRGDPNQISTCPHCHLTLPIVTLRWHEVTLLHFRRFVYTLPKSFNYKTFPLCVLGEVPTIHSLELKRA